MLSLSSLSNLTLTSSSQPLLWHNRSGLGKSFSISEVFCDHYPHDIGGEGTSMWGPGECAEETWQSSWNPFHCLGLAFCCLGDSLHGSGRAQVWRWKWMSVSESADSWQLLILTTWQRPFRSQGDIPSPARDVSDPCIYLPNQFRPCILEAAENLTQIILGRRRISLAQGTRKFRRG